MSSTTRIALFGDSYVSRLGKFCDYDLKVPGVVKFFGRGGMTIDRYDETLFQELLRFQPDVVFINLGGNDISSQSVPKDIARKIIALVETLKTRGIKTVYVAEVCERGLFRKDPNLTKKSFNAQRKKINKLIQQCEYVKLVELKMRFPKDYDNDKVHFSTPRGLSKYMFCVRRLLCSHKCIC